MKVHENQMLQKKFVDFDFHESVRKSFATKRFCQIAIFTKSQENQMLQKSLLDLDFHESVGKSFDTKRFVESRFS
jgi:hypothetical protein